MTGQIIQLSDDDHLFPSPSHALEEPNGLLAIGGDLTPQRLVTAYYNGIFPWYGEEDPILWWSPTPRAILEFNELHVSKSLKKFIRKSSYRITRNNAFSQVINACAKPRGEDGTWIMPEMISAYERLHELGIAHSIEVWDDEELVGGLYGVLIGQCYCGESMFSSKANTSKMAFVALVQLLQKTGATFLDCQIQNPHLETLGVKELDRNQFLDKLESVRDAQVQLDQYHSISNELSITL